MDTDAPSIPPRSWEGRAQNPSKKGQVALHSQGFEVKPEVLKSIAQKQVRNISDDLSAVWDLFPCMFPFVGLKFHRS